MMSPARQIDIRSFKSGLELLYRRGPDSHGIEELDHGRTLLGHTRLSIIDTSTAGNQPLSNQDKTLWIVFNGEVYNYLEIRQDLELRGYQFKTRTDTEVILLAYEEWGKACISRLRGVYAFGIYSVVDKSLFLARDQSGVKPLYYLDHGDLFGFASTPTALLAAVGKQKEINDRALMSYLWFGNIPGSLSIYKNISKLSPGATLLVKGEMRDECRTPYLDNAHTAAYGNKAIEEQVKALVEISLSINQRSDVPVAYFLSGGLDSTIICSLAQEGCTTAIPTFSIGFDTPNSDETPYALHASSIIGTNHSTTILTYEKALGQLWDVASSFDEPFHINGLIPFTFLCKYVRECGYKVAIGGDGADEIFGGYLWHSTWWEEQSRSRMGSFGSIRNRLGIRTPSLTRYLDIFLESSGGVSKDILSGMDASSPNEFIHAQLMADISRTNDSIKYPLLIDQGCFLPDHCLPKIDRCSMYYGLEVRVPFLDQTILSFITQLSGNQINPDFQRKHLLQRVFNKQLVSIDLNRKKGFSSPLREWWKKGLHRVADYAFSNSELIQSSGLLSQLVQKTTEKQDISSLVTLFSLALWSDCWMEKQVLSDYDLLVSL